MIRAAIAGAVAAATLAIAAGADAQVIRRCQAYQEQFDRMRDRYADHPDFDLARRYRLLGEKYCNTGYNSAGQKVIRHAIELLGAAPKTPKDDAGPQTRTFRTF